MKLKDIRNSLVSKLTTYFLIGSLAWGGYTLAQKYKDDEECIAVMYLDIGENIIGSKNLKRPLTDKLQTEIVNIGKYSCIVDRVNLDKILKEYELQLSGLVREEKAVKVGRLLGAEKVATGSVNLIGDIYYINTELIDVETGKIEASADEECNNCKLEELLGSISNVGQKLMGLSPTPKGSISSMSIYKVLKIPLGVYWFHFADWIWDDTIICSSRNHEKFDRKQYDISEEFNIIKDTTVIKEITIIPPRVAEYIDLSPDKNRIVFSARDRGSEDIYITDLDTGYTKSLTFKPSGVYGRSRNPAFSPDGKKIVFYANYSEAGDFEKNFEIYVMNADGSNQINLTNNFIKDSHPDWSPDNKKILFVRNDSTLYTMNSIDGKNLKKIIEVDCNVSDPAWSPNGKQIIFACSNDLYITDSNGNQKINLTGDTGLCNFKPCTSPKWSPDGKKIITINLGSPHILYLD